MSPSLTPESVAEAMYALVQESHGKRNLKALDLTKAMSEQCGATKDLCKQAIRLLIDNERCVYSYLGGSYIVLPPAM